MKMKRILSHAGLAACAAASMLMFAAAPAHAEFGQGCSHTWGIDGTSVQFTDEYLDGAIREEYEFMRRVEGPDGVYNEVKVTKYRCSNGAWLYQGFEYRYIKVDPFGPRPRPDQAPILE